LTGELRAATGVCGFATQNPIEHQGTYPLPEAQKDRFLVKIRMGYPDVQEENELAMRVANGEAPSGG